MVVFALWCASHWAEGMQCPEGVQVCAWCGRGRQAVAVRNRWTASSFFWRGPIQHGCPKAGRYSLVGRTMTSSTPKSLYTPNDKTSAIAAGPLMPCATQALSCTGCTNTSAIDGEVQTMSRRDRPPLCAIAGRHRPGAVFLRHYYGAHRPCRWRHRDRPPQ
jgi:hypothetical protein